MVHFVITLGISGKYTGYSDNVQTQKDVKEEFLSSTPSSLKQETRVDFSFSDLLV